MDQLAKLVDTEEKINQFKKRYGFPKDVQIRYASSDNLALLEYRDLVLPIIAIVEGGVRIPMHPFLIQFLTHFRLSPLQCVPNVFRVVMGTAVLMEKLGLHLTVHDITNVFQATGRKQYTLVACNSDRKLVTGLPNSSKGRDEDILVITGNWQNPLISCPLIPGEPEFTAKKVEFVERKTVEHLLKRPCFIDSGRRLRSAPILLDYEPSYKSFQSGLTVKDSKQAKVTVSLPGRDQEEIIQVVPLTARREVQVPQLVTPLTNPNFVPSVQSSEPGLPVTRPGEDKWPMLSGRLFLLSRDMKIWQGDSFEHMIENLKRNSVLAVQGIFEASSRLLEKPNVFSMNLLPRMIGLQNFEKKALAMIHVAESKHKSVEASLMTVLSAPSGGAEVHEAQVAAKKAEDSAQAYYDQGFDEAANSLMKSQLAEECNKYFIQGWQEHEEKGAAEGQMDPDADDSQILVVEVQEGKGGFDGKDTVNVVD
uniref:Transposase (putative) gypsy type domain-containing protein n=1 Tax=Fagus sylvatica TaxID=28930 RepID=A0A2N9GN85_FAGSY